jgi:hypothetical protein
MRSRARRNWLTFREVGDRLGRDVRWVRARVEEGTIKAHKFSERVRMVSEADFNGYVRSCEAVTGN